MLKTIGFNCKTTFWHLLCIIWCKNFYDDDDEEESCPRKKSDDIITIAKAALYRIFARHNNAPNQYGKKKTDSKNHPIIIEKIKPQSKSEFILPVEIAKTFPGKLNDSLLTEGYVPKESTWIIGDLPDTDDDKLQCPASYSDDDSSSISDVKSQDDFVNYIDQNQSLSLESTDQGNLNTEIESNYSHPIKADEVGVIVVEDELGKFEDRTRFLTDIVMPPIPNDKPKSYSATPSEDFWEWIDPTLEEPMELVDDEVSLLTPDDGYSTIKNSETLSINDGDLLKEKIKWLIPVTTDHVDIYLKSAIEHFFQVLEVTNPDTLNESLLIATKSLPSVFIDSPPMVSELEIGDALLDDTKKSSYIDRRIIFHLVRDIFSDLYDEKRCVHQMPWTYFSYMVKKKNYTLWKGKQPPESFELVNEIVRETVHSLLNVQSNVGESNISLESERELSNFNVVKWCVSKQKDKVDRLLAKELRKEENLWLIYDEAEEMIKFKIADDIFNYLFNDSIEWLGIVDVELGKL